MLQKLYRPFIGIPFVRSEEVTKVLELFGRGKARTLMVEARVSQASLQGRPVDPLIRLQFPDPNKLAAIHRAGSDVVNYVRYSAEDTDSARIFSDFLKLQDMLGPQLHGIFLDFNWPKADPMHWYMVRADANARFMIRIGPPTFNEMQAERKSVRSYLDRYEACVTDIVLDPFGKKGDKVDTDFFIKVFTDVLTHYPAMRVCVTCGNDKTKREDLLAFIASLVFMYPELSVTASREKLWMQNKQLDYDKIALYLNDMHALLTHE